MKVLLMGLLTLLSVSAFARETKVECVNTNGKIINTVSGSDVKNLIKKITGQGYSVVSVLPLNEDGYTEEVCVTFEKL